MLVHVGAHVSQCELAHELCASELQPLRSKSFPQGKPDIKSAADMQALRIANAITRNTFDLAASLNEQGIHVSIENPSTSLLHHLVGAAL
jgi:hypothetical protein